MRTRSILLVSLFVSLACDRGPEPSDQPPAPSSHASTEGPARDDPHGGGTKAPAAADPHAGLDMGGGAAPSGTPTAGGIKWNAPAPFRAQRPSSAMRAAEYVVPEEGAGEEPATMTVFFFGSGQGGTVESNVDRWVGQFQPEGGGDPRAAARITRRTVNGMPVTRIDTTGTFSGMQMPGAPAGGAKPNQRLLGAIVEGPQGLVFFKLTGPRAVVTRAERAFDEMIGSFEPAS